MQRQSKHLLITEIAMSAAVILFIFFCLRGRVRDDVALGDLTPSLLAATADQDNMKEAGAMKLRALYGLSANDYEEVVLYVPVSNMDAEEMLVVKCASEDQTEAVAEAMNERIDYEKSIFESYGVEQMGIISKAVVDVQGKYCLYICDDNSSAVQAAFESAVKE